MESKTEASRPRSVRERIVRKTASTDRPPAGARRSSAAPRPVPPSPSPLARTQLAAADRRVRARATQIRRSFVNSQYGSTPPPLSAIVKGGRAGGVRLRLMLALLWLAGGGDERHALTVPARALAELLDLDAPDAAGQRRVRDAAGWLEHQGLITVDRDPGRPLTITLQREDGSGKPYISPLRAPKSKSTGKLARAHWSILLPSPFWTSGWALALSTPALALLLIMLDLERADGRHAWITPELAQDRYCVSEDSWTRGVAELRGARPGESASPARKRIPRLAAHAKHLQVAPAQTQHRTTLGRLSLGTPRPRQERGPDLRAPSRATPWITYRW